MKTLPAGRPRSRAVHGTPSRSPGGPTVSIPATAPSAVLAVLLAAFALPPVTHARAQPLGAAGDSSSGPGAAGAARSADPGFSPSVVRSSGRTARSAGVQAELDRPVSPGVRIWPPDPSWVAEGIERRVRLEQRLRVRPLVVPGRPVADGLRRVAGWGSARSPAEGGLGRAQGEPGGTTVGMIGGGLLGGTLGFAAGFLGGFSVLKCGLEVPNTCVTVWVATMAITTGTGVSTGVHLANDSRGDWLPSSAVTVGLAGLGHALAMSANFDDDLQDDDTAQAAVAFSLTSVAQLVTAVLIERGTSGETDGSDDGPS